MTEKESDELNIKDFKYSFNKYNKIYNLEILEFGKWRRLTLDEDAFKTAIKIKFRTKDNTRNNPYKPYLKYRIVWGLMNFWKWIKKIEPKLKKIQKSAIFAILFFITMLFIKHYIENEQKDTIRKYEQEMRLKEKTIQNYKVFSDSLLKEIKQKELKEKGGSVFPKKDSSLKQEKDF